MTSTAQRGLARLFAPQSVAIIGASTAEEKVGYQLVSSLRKFNGRVYPINPKATEIAGHRAYPSLQALPEAPDLAILAIPASACPAALAEAASAGVGGATMIALAFLMVAVRAMGRCIGEPGTVSTSAAATSDIPATPDQLSAPAVVETEAAPAPPAITDAEEECSVLALRPAMTCENEEFSTRRAANLPTGRRARRRTARTCRRSTRRTRRRAQGRA